MDRCGDSIAVFERHTTKGDTKTCVTICSHTVLAAVQSSPFRGGSFDSWARHRRWTDQDVALKNFGLINSQVYNMMRPTGTPASTNYDRLYCFWQEILSQTRMEMQGVEDFVIFSALQTAKVWCQW